MSSSKISSDETVSTIQADVPNSEKIHDSLSDVPDGGAVAWMTTVGSWLAIFATFGYTSAFGVYQDYYTRIFMTNKTASDISWIGSTQLGLAYMMSGVSGKLLDMGYFHSCIRVGSSLYIFCLFMTSLAHQYEYYQVFLPQAIGLGIAQGLVILPSVGIISHHFKKRRSLATGIVISGSSVGGIVFPIMLNRIIEKSGFAWGVRATGLVALACLMAASLMMKTRLPPRTPQDSGSTLSYGMMMSDRPFLLTVFGKVDLASILELWLTQSRIFCIQLGVWFPIFYLQLFAIKHSLDDNLAFYSLAILNVVSTLGRILPNFISDKFGMFGIIIPCSTLIGLLAFVMLSIRSSAAFIAFAVLYGFFSGSFLSLFTPTAATHTKSVHEVGTRLGFAYMISGIAILAGPPISGALLTDEYLWYRPIVFAGVMVLAGAGSLVVSKMIMSRPNQGA